MWVNRLGSRVIILLGSAVLLLQASAQSKASESTETDVSANTKVETQTLVGLLEQAHYNRANVKPRDYADIIGDYMRALDGRRMVFRRSDEVELSKTYGRGLREDLKSGNLRAALAVAERYRTLVSLRASWIEKFFPHAFPDSPGETCPRTEAEWAEDDRQSEERWSKHLHAEFIDEVLNGATTEDAERTIRSRYQKWNERIAPRPPEDFIETFLTTVAKRYDSQSTYYGPTTFNRFKEGSSAAGIGALLIERRGRIYFQEVLPGGPAYNSSQIESGDELLRIQESDSTGTDLVGMNLNEAVALLAGTPGTAVTLFVHPHRLSDSSWRRSVTLTRGAVEGTRARAYGTLFLDPTGSGTNVPIGVVTLPGFYGQLTLQSGAKADASGDVTTLVESLYREKIRGLVLDLRGNSGGYLNEAVNIVGLFIGQRPIIRTRDFMGKEAAAISTLPLSNFRGPIVVLVDERSASASEIVAGTLRNYGRALIVGRRTYGNGVIQTVLDFRSLVPSLAKSGALTGGARFTVQQFFLPNGGSPQLTGLAPDIPIPSGEAPAIRMEAMHPLPQAECAPFARDAHRIPADFIQRIAELSRTRQATLSDLTRLKVSEDHLLAIETKPIVLDIDFRRRGLNQERATMEGDGQLADSSAPSPVRTLSLDEKKDGLKGDSERIHSNRLDPPLVESLRIVEDAIVDGKWQPVFD